MASSSFLKVGFQRKLGFLKINELFKIIFTIFILFSCSRNCSLMCHATCSICSRASIKHFLSGCESGVFLITSSSNSLYLKRSKNIDVRVCQRGHLKVRHCIKINSGTLLLPQCFHSILHTGCVRQNENPTNFKIVKEPLLVRKQTTSQQKALDFSFNLAP